MYKHEDCFVIGAGFSHVYSASAPLMRGFLTKAIELGAFIPGKHDMLMPEMMRHMLFERKKGGSHKELAEIASRYFGEYRDINIEQLATFLRADTVPYEAKEPRDRAYDQLLLVILNTLKGIYSNPRTEKIKPLFSEFASALVSLEIPVISFNYDLLLDQLLLDTKKWLPNDGYAVRIPIGGSGGASSYVENKINQRPPSSTVLLKLHGSLNWGMRDVGYEDGSHPIEIPPVMGDKILPIADLVTVGPGRLSINYQWRPFIIPPLFDKKVLNAHPLIKTIWHQARDVLASSRNIHILGYSLPSGDFEVDTLFRESFYSFLAAFEKRTLFFVNKDPDANRRAKIYERNDVKVNTDISEIEEYLRRFVEDFRQAPTREARMERKIQKFVNETGDDGK